jgi:hypothetical protein
MQWVVTVMTKRGTGGLSLWEVTDSQRCELPQLFQTTQALVAKAVDLALKTRPAGRQYNVLVAVQVRASDGRQPLSPK